MYYITGAILDQFYSYFFFFFLSEVQHVSCKARKLDAKLRLVQ